MAKDCWVRSFLAFQMNPYSSIVLGEKGKKAAVFDPQTGYLPTFNCSKQEIFSPVGQSDDRRARFQTEEVEY